MNLLLTGAFPYTQEQIASLQNLGCAVYFLQYESDALPLPAAETHATVCNGLFLHHAIDKFTRLRYIQLTSAGLDRVPMDRITARKIRIHNARGVYGIPMAEWAVFRVLERYKQAEHFREAQKKVLWSKDRSLREIQGTRVAVVGAGNVGQEVAKRFGCFGAEITGFDIRTDLPPGFDCMQPVRTLASAIGEFDIVVITAPLTELTRHLFCETLLSRMKEHAILVNIARGPIVDQEALCRVLKVRPDLFAALDVFEQEPLPACSPLWSLPNVALSPHNSFVSNGNADRMFTIILANLQAFIETEGRTFDEISVQP